MPTTPQLKILHVAARQVGLIVGSDAVRWRLLLRNVGGVESSKQLDNAGVEDVMAVLEDMGFVDLRGAGYWAGKVRRRNCECGERMARKIETMAAESRYPVGPMCRRMSKGRTDFVGELTPREAWELIEAYKATEERERVQPRLFDVAGYRTKRKDAPSGATREEAGTDAGTGIEPAALTRPGVTVTDDDDPPF